MPTSPGLGYHQPVLTPEMAARSQTDPSTSTLGIHRLSPGKASAPSGLVWTCCNLLSAFSTWTSDPVAHSTPHEITFPAFNLVWGRLATRYLQRSKTALGCVKRNTNEPGEGR